MKRWKLVVKLSLVTLFVLTCLVLILFRYISFSQTAGFVVDEKGNPVSSAHVAVSYNCKKFSLTETRTHHFGEKRTETDAAGQFLFDATDFGSFNRISFPYTCEKTITVFKEGYCDDFALCSRELSSGGLSKEQLGSRFEATKEDLLYQNGRYFESAYFTVSKTVHSEISDVSFELKTYQEY